jgi:hypothetical protein
VKYILYFSLNTELLQWQKFPFSSGEGQNSDKLTILHKGWGKGQCSPTPLMKFMPKVIIMLPTWRVLALNGLKISELFVISVGVCIGLTTALVEKDDFASATSSRSTKLIHGGVRYLQKAIFNLSYEQV